MNILSESQWLEKVKKARLQVNSPYFAMYSSWASGIVKDPSLMFVPIDDHLVHRGDGIFEAARAIDGSVFDLKAHLDRLFLSAAQISLPLRWSRDEICELCLEVCRAAGKNELTLRIFVSRGPGLFSPNPYDSKQSELYIVATEFKAIPEAKYQSGASVIYSAIPQKDPFFARIKSCNYLPNVLMKKESVDQKVDFSIGLDAEGFILEGPTENIVCIDRQQNFLVPHFNSTLRGTTLMALIEAIQESKSSQIKQVKEIRLSKESLETAAEVMMVGTTLEVLPVTSLNQKPIASGKVGPLAPQLRSWLKHKIATDARRRNPIY